MKKFDLAALLLTSAFIFAAIIVSLNRYWQYETFFYDFGIFDQAIWKVSRLQPPIIDHLTVGGKWIFADHFNPSIFLLSPFYWITDRSEMLLIMQAIMVGLSGLVLYQIGKKVIKDQILAFTVLISYFLFVGLQNAVITDFHEVTVMTLPLMFTFWAVVNKKIRWFFFFLLLTLGFKESAFLLGIGIGLAIFFIARDWYKIGLATIFISIVWGVISIKVIIPYFSGDVYYYAPLLPLDPLSIIRSFFDHPIKRETLFYSFASFGFLPLLSPPFWSIFLQDFFSRFIPAYSFTRWGLGLHYSAQLAPILAIASIFSLGILTRRTFFLKLHKVIAIMLILNSFIIYHFVLHGPLALAYNFAFYKHTSDFKFLDELVNKVPKNAKVMTQNNLVVRFAHQDVLLLRDNYEHYKPDYIVVDIREGQNPNNFFGTKKFDSTITQLRKDPQYKAIFQTKEQFVYKRL